jgi:hypothetical protein
MRPTLRRALGENNDVPLAGRSIRKKEARCEAGLLIFNAMCQKSHLAGGIGGIDDPGINNSSADGVNSSCDDN